MIESVVHFTSVQSSCHKRLEVKVSIMMVKAGNEAMYLPVQVWFLVCKVVYWTYMDLKM